MYLGRNLRDLEGNEHAMVSAIPVSSRIDSPRLSLGYRTLQALGDGPLLHQGEVVRGHEFHWSVPENNHDRPSAYRIIDKGRHLEGFHRRNLLASYIYLHLGGPPLMAMRFIDNRQRYQDSPEAL